MSDDRPSEGRWVVTSTRATAAAAPNAVERIFRWIDIIVVMVGSDAVAVGFWIHIDVICFGFWIKIRKSSQTGDTGYISVIRNIAKIA